MQAVIHPFLNTYTTQDVLHEMIVCCYEAISQKNIFSKSKATKNIKEMLKRRREEYYKLYNPHRNLSLNQCLGESTTPISEWMNLSKWLE